MQTIVSVYQWAINHDKRYWSDPYTFAPERWIGDPKYSNDQLGRCSLWFQSLVVKLRLKSDILKNMEYHFFHRFRDLYELVHLPENGSC